MHARLQALATRCGLGELEVVEGQGEGFRQRARLAVRGRVGTPKIGIYEVGTHQVVDIPRCPIHAPAINRVGAAVKAAIRITKTPLYSEAAHAGVLRYLQVVVERKSGAAQVVVVCNGREPDTATPLLEALQGSLGAELHSLTWNGQPSVSNQILGPHWHTHSGPAAVCEHLGGADVFYPPAAFGQANLDLFERIVTAIHARVAADVPVVELYAGVGAIGLGLAMRGEQVVFNEVGEGSLQGLRMGIAAAGPAVQARARVVPGAAEDVVRQLPLRGAQVIVDPPRKGLHPQVVESLIEARPQRVLYLSCGFESFLRDADSLIAAGFECVELQPYALFPFTDHVEILANFENSRRA